MGFKYQKIAVGPDNICQRRHSTMYLFSVVPTDSITTGFLLVKPVSGVWRVVGWDKPWSKREEHEVNARIRKGVGASSAL